MMKLAKRAAALVLAAVLAFSLTACSPKEVASNLILKTADLLGLREEGSDDDEADEIVAQPGGEVNFPDGLQDTSVHWNQQVQDGTLYVAFNSIQNRNTEYFVAGSDTVQVTGYATTESTGILEFKVALWELSDHFLCGGHHGVFPDRRGVQHLYHLRLDPRQAVQGQCQL